jgi:hypothetical protein
MSSTQQLLLGEGAGGAAPAYIEEVFSTYLYTGTGANQTITNDIDLSTKGGMVWIKQRTIPSGTGYHFLYDSARGTGGGSGFAFLNSNTTSANGTNSETVSTFNSNGFSLGADSGGWGPNRSGSLEVSWTFRKQPKFFDVLTYSGSNSNQTITHNLGSAPGCIIIKKTDSTTFNAGWAVYHRSLTNPNNYYLVLNTDAAETNYGAAYISSVSSTTFTVAGGAGSISLAGSTYVAYLFAHNAGGFGATGSDNVISCGSFVTDGSGKITAPVNLGYEPQWLLVKNYGASENWVIYDIMRGMSNTGYAALNPNTAGAEYTGSSAIAPNATGFNTPNASGPFASFANYIYIAIRRGPMKTPTVGTSVFKVETYNQTSASDPAFNLGKVADAGLRRVSDFEDSWRFQSRLTGNGGLITSTSGAESTMNFGNWDNNVGWYQGAVITPPYSQANWYGWTFARAPSFFDVVCYTGTGTAGQTFNHNLGVVPEMMIVKGRSIAEEWNVYYGVNTTYLKLNSTDVAQTATTRWNDTSPTSSVFSLGTSNWVNGSGSTYIAYLFATCAGVSKVGSYTGNGSTQTINCGFTGGARFVLIKRTDATGGWYTYDTVRGMTVLTDPYLFLNSTAVEVATLGSVTTVSTGFALDAAVLAAINTNGGSYIFLAIA